MNIDFVKDLLMEQSKKRRINYLSSCSDDAELYVYMYNYNWEDGFEIPQSILDNPYCSLSTSLLIFHNADGMRKFDKEYNSVNLKRWKSFVDKLYKDIKSAKYKANNVGFTVPMSKVEIYKAKKFLNEDDFVFITNIEGEDYNINL